MQLIQLIQDVKEQNLSRDQLEAYHTQISSMFSQMNVEMADLEKAEALFMAKDFGEKKSVAERKVLWKATPEGQRLIMLKRYSVATKELINSLKSRIYKLL